MTENSGKVRRFPLPEGSAPEPLPRLKKPAARKPASDEEEKLAAEALIAKFAALNKEDYAGLSDSPRRRSREAALLLLYQMEMGGEDWQLAEKVLEDVELSPECAYFAKELAHNAAADKEYSIEMIGKYARDWIVERFASIDRCILYLAVSEMRRDESDNAAVIINEAIEMAKKFGDENSGPFINGILDAIRIREFSAKAATEK